MTGIHDDKTPTTTAASPTRSRQSSPKARARARADSGMSMKTLHTTPDIGSTVNAVTEKPEFSKTPPAAAQELRRVANNQKRGWFGL